MSRFQPERRPTTPTVIDLLVALLMQPKRPRDGVREDFEAARRR
jgi:hypothetical protein